jgi:hypothetical protein
VADRPTVLSWRAFEHATDRETFMTALRVMREQQLLAPSEDQDFSRYAGMWVLLREGAVVAAGSDPSELMEQGDTRDTDVLVRVPDEGTDAALF